MITEKIENTSFISVLIYTCLFISLNSCAQSAKCLPSNGIKNTISKIYEAEPENGNFIKSEGSALSVTEENFDKRGSILSSKSTSIYDGDTMEDLSTFNYENGVLKSTIRESKENDKLILESKLLLQVIATSNLNLPTQVRDADSTTLIKYTYNGCLEETQTMTMLNDNKVFKTRTFDYNEKSEVIDISTVLDFEEKVVSKTSISNYVYNDQGDWTQRIIKNPDGTYNLEIRTLTYY